MKAYEYDQQRRRDNKAAAILWATRNGFRGRSMVLHVDGATGEYGFHTPDSEPTGVREVGRVYVD